MSTPRSPLLEAIEVLARAGVEFVVVGVTGINFYARDAGQLLVTADVDVLLPPRSSVLRAALNTLQRSGFELSAGGEPFVDIEAPEILERVVRAGASITAENAAGARIDLMLSGRGLSYEDLDADAVAFRVGDVEVRVGRLGKLLRSKQLAGRPKDIEFLRMFAARLRSEADAD